MQAYMYTRYGTPDGLRAADIAQPVPRKNEVLIKVYAVSLNDWDYGLLTGKPYANRLPHGLFKPGKLVLGSDVAGRIEAVGSDVTRFRPGDEVFGDLSGTWGGLAEYVCAREDALACKPAAMSFVEAAAIPQAAMLAVQAIHDCGKLQHGQTVLINGAGGGFGTFGVQIIKSVGAQVTGVDSAGKLDMMRATGFDHVIDYTQQDFTRNGRLYDLILDAKTTRSTFAYARALAPRGRYVTVGGSIPRLLQTIAFSPWIAKTQQKFFSMVILKPNKDLAYMIELFETGKVKPVIDGPYRFDQTVEAFRLFGKADHKGKVVITIARD